MKAAQQTNNIKYPYPRVKGIADLMKFIQEPGWRPEVIDVLLLKRLRISPSHEGAIIYALRFLGLIDDAKAPTLQFDKLKANFQSTLASIVKEKYSPLFKEIPPKLANQDRLVGFFGEPVETAEYQAMFFVSLCQTAGIELPNVQAKFHRARFDKHKRP